MSASTHEAVLGGARWRLTLHPDGRWDVAKMLQRCWAYVISGNDGLAGAIREAIRIGAVETPRTFELILAEMGL